MVFTDSRNEYQFFSYYGVIIAEKNLIFTQSNFALKKDTECVLLFKNLMPDSSEIHFF